jgi:hypothetical protein
MRNESPFRAGFGKVPPVLAGRSELIDSFRTAIEVGTWSQERALLIRGFRGVGKTVTVETLRRIAEDSGWVTVNETASPGFLHRIENKLRIEIASRNPLPTTRVRAVSITPLGSVELDHASPTLPKSTVESLLSDLATIVEPSGGILLTIDEVNTGTIEEFRELTGALQRAVSDDREIAIIMAGLHSEVAAVLKDRSSTFLRRAVQWNLDLLDFESAIDAIRRPIIEHGRTISTEAVDYAAAATQGYPFLTQLVGDFAWKTQPEQTDVSLDDVKRAARLAKGRMGANVHEPSLAALSDTDRHALVAIAQDETASKVSVVRQRMNVSAQHFNVYRNRLLDAGLIYQPARGYIDFALPYLREYLREHAITDAMGATASDIARARQAFPPPPADLN